MNPAGRKKCLQTRAAVISSAKMRYDNSPEKNCRKIFGVKDVPVPTSFVVLPYELLWDPEMEQLIVPTKDHLEVAQQIGNLLLAINKITAKLSFWLAMKTHLSDWSFRQKLKEWIKRARTDNKKLVASEIVKCIRCRTEYIDLCEEVRAKDDFHSKARAYIKDPVKAATDEFKHCLKSLHKCYSTGTFYLYLLDEYRWTPVESNVNYFGISYPLVMNSDKRLLENLFLPFMNISLMIATAVDGLQSLKRWLGLPPCCGVPGHWMSEKEGLIHNVQRPASVVEFASLQRAMREEVLGGVGVTNEFGNFCPSDDQLQSELELLKKFFKEHDQAGRYSDLRRVSDGNGSKLWLNDSALQDLLEEIKIARAQRRVQKMIAGSESIEKLDEEMKKVMMTVKFQQGLDNSTLSWCTAATEQSNSTCETQSTNVTSRMKNQGKKMVKPFIRLCRGIR